MDLITSAQLLGSFGEFFGAIAVVATLGYLSLQIRQNTRSSYVSRAAEITQQLSNIQENLICNADLTALLARCRNPLPTDLSPLEEERIEGIAQLYLKAFAAAQTAHRNGEMPDVQFEVFATEFRRIVESYPGLKPKMRLTLEHFDMVRYPIYAPAFD